MAPLLCDLSFYIKKGEMAGVFFGLCFDLFDFSFIE